MFEKDVFTPRPDEVTYGTVMAACERAKEWHKVLELSRLMESERSDLVMDGMAISSALHACQQLSYGHAALDYLEKMKELRIATSSASASASASAEGGRHDSDSSNHGHGGNRRGNRRRQALKGPDDVAYRLTISACARGGLLTEAIELLHQMEKDTGSPPDVVAYSAAMEGCAKLGEYVQAFDLLREMKKKGVAPNVITYSAAISACATASANAAASRQKSKANDPFYSEDATLAMIQEPMRAGLKLLDHMKTSGNKDAEPNIVTYNVAIRACAEGGGDVSKAFELLDDLLERGLEPTIVTYGTLMTACERVADVEGASKVFRAMKENDIVPNEIIYGAAISCCRKAFQPERAVLLLRKMLQDNLYPNTAVFNTVIMAQTEAKNMDKASAVFKLLTSSHAKKANPNRQTYSILIRAMTSNSQPADAEYYLDRMREDNMKPDVDLLTATVTSYERNGEPIKALKLMETMREDGYDFYEMKLFDAAFKQGVKVINTVVSKSKGFGGGNATLPKSNDDMEGDYATQEV